MNFWLINSILGRVIMLQGLFMLLPCIIGIFYGERNDALAYLFLSVLCLVVGKLARIRKPKSATFYAKDGFLAVSLSWIIMSLIGALPFVLNGDIPNYTDALFKILDPVVVKPEIISNKASV